MEKKLIAAAVSSVLAVPMAAQAVEFAVSGHVNRAVIILDQEGHPEDGDLQHVDSNASETRFRFTGSEELDAGLTAGVNLELGKPSAWRTRHAAVSLSGAGGKLTMGQTGTAASGAEDAHGAFNGGSWLAGVTNWCSYASPGPACVTDGVSRTDVLRYDTPSIGPAKIAVSTGNNEYWDAKLTLAGSMGEAGYDFRVGYWQREPADGLDNDAILTSGAISFGQGTSIGAAWVQDDFDLDAVKAFGAYLPESQRAGLADANVTRDRETVFLTVDHSYGDGSVGLYWRQGDVSGSVGGAKVVDVDSSLWGIGIGHNIGAGVSAYAGFRQVKKDDVVLSDDSNLYLAGMRVSFN